MRRRRLVEHSEPQHNFSFRGVAERVAMTRLHLAWPLPQGYNNVQVMAWEVEYSDEFGEWFERLTARQQIKLTASVELLEAKGPHLEHPHSTRSTTSRFHEMRELRIQIAGDPWRIFYAFDPRRVAYLIVGGCKVGKSRFYPEMVAKADAIFEQHLRQL
jgi:hypothetical protein